MLLTGYKRIIVNLMFQNDIEHKNCTKNLPTSWEINQLSLLNTLSTTLLYTKNTINWRNKCKFHKKEPPNYDIFDI